MSNPTTLVRPKTIGLSDELHGYLVANSCRTHPALKALVQETFSNPISAGWARMCSPLDSAEFLQMMVQLTNAKKVVEVGVFTGFTALAFALALPDDGQVFALDVSKEYASVGQPFWQEAKVDSKIKLMIGDATNTMKDLLKEHEGDVDIIFIDADKANYDNYYETGLKLVCKGGIVLIDNVLWHGAVIDKANKSPDTEAIRALNAKVFADDRVTICMLPLSDGVTIARKK